MGLDNLERKISFVLGTIALVLAAILVPHLLHDTWVTDTAKPLAGKSCPTHYELVRGVCTYTHLTHPSAWLPQFLEILLIGLALIGFTWRRKRAGVAAAALLLGLALGTAGLPFILGGGWLIVRAFRLQKYGDASFSGSSRRAREISAERRAQRRAPTPSTPSPATRRTPDASKRYTPKKSATRRR